MHSKNQTMRNLRNKNRAQSHKKININTLLKSIAKHLSECKPQKLQHGKPRAELENLRVYFGTRHFLPKLYTNFKIT